MSIVDADQIQVSSDALYRDAFCRAMGSLSLFDFGLTATGICSQFHNWVGWLGHQQRAKVAIWLEVDRHSCKGGLLEAGPAKERWDESSSNRSRTFIPGVEACHYGPIASSALLGVLFVARDDRERFQYGPLDGGIIDRLNAFEAVLPPSPDDDIVGRLEAGRLRCLRS